jgi:hypothetical protein
MIQNESSANLTPERPRGDADLAPSASQDLQQLVDPDKQEEYRAAYLAQLRQRACPGCGESDVIF